MKRKLFSPNKMISRCSYYGDGGKGNASRLLFLHRQYYCVYGIIRSSMEKKFNLTGWILFIVCAGFFITSAIKANDIWYLVGSFIFLGGCVMFIIPLIRRR